MRRNSPVSVAAVVCMADRVWCACGARQENARWNVSVCVCVCCTVNERGRWARTRPYVKAAAEKRTEGTTSTAVDAVRSVRLGRPSGRATCPPRHSRRRRVLRWGAAAVSRARATTVAATSNLATPLPPPPPPPAIAGHATTFCATWQ